MAEARLYREYETIMVLKPDTEDAKVVEVAERLRSLVQDQGGKSIKFHNWGKKKLAFEVDKQQKGIYVHHLYVAPPVAITEYERILKYLDDALLYQTIRLADVLDLDARAVEEDQLIAPVRESGRRDRDERTHDGPRPTSDAKPTESTPAAAKTEAKTEAAPETKAEAAPETETKTEATETKAETEKAEG